ncbi:MAG: CBS domain-containing protein, partial [Cyclobacteriaceae bacterium]|nr:CBS domain-containing protein [Cyclobacteriaceae bacterium]
DIRIDSAKASDVLSRNPKTIASGELAVKALQIMQQNSITQLVVIKEGKVHGFIHLHDLLKEGIV